MSIEYDGFFVHEGNRIFYNITENDRPIQMINGVEKMSRFITFYDAGEQNLGTRAIYGEIEKLQNIWPEDALNWYLESYMFKKD
jgi:hypothetical protein